MTHPFLCAVYLSQPHHLAPSPAEIQYRTLPAFPGDVRKSLVTAGERSLLPDLLERLLSQVSGDDYGSTEEEVQPVDFLS